MKKKMRVAIGIGIASFLLVGCSGVATGEEAMNDMLDELSTEVNITEAIVDDIDTVSIEYTFEKCNPEDVDVEIANICNVYEIDDQNGHSLFLGQVKTLFGEPDYITKDNENMFSCMVSATDKEGNVIYLDIYYGPSGPAIGGDYNDEESSKAAAELSNLIIQAEPTDYDWEGYYIDIPVKINMGVKNGKPYNNSEILELSDEEYMELIDEVYGF